MAEHWENRYASSTKVWSGRPNVTLTQVAPTLPVGRSLDLGCGEGTDAIWLASQGWDAVGIDFSPTAIQRASDAARDAGVTRVRFEVADLNTWDDEVTFDLVTAFFFHSRMEPDRTRILQRAANRLAPGGHLLLVSHAEFPPWAPASEQRRLTPQQEVTGLGLDPASFEPVLAEIRSQPARRPDGESATINDVVVMVARKA